ncbi:MAG TPA: TIGR00730 family Rossman fold protein [Candidatus Hydrogenedentes bacterium]|nr:TIGR00730 family Rossman fold protein [Candidatus Hydrogenedentota bacterium]
MTKKRPEPPALERPPKAYRNEAFLGSPDGRPIRVLCEFEEPKRRFRRYRIRNTIVFFGSARIRPAEETQAKLAELREQRRGTNERTPELDKAYEAAKHANYMSRYYQDAMELSERLTRWSKTLHSPSERFIICSGGGPGIMEAANRGAYNVGGHSIGLNISLPHEQHPNPYQTPELAFEFHYFFIRKFWFVYLAQAMVVFPGGFGTLDEFIELLTLVQTGKTAKRVPIVVYGSRYWKEVINFDALIQWGTISAEDLDLFRFCDSVDEAFDYLKIELEKRR